MALIPLSVYGKYTQSFIVTVGERSIKVVSPQIKVDIVSVIIKNETLDNIYSELRSKDKVLEKFNLKAQGNKIIQVDYKKAKSLFYVPISPPFDGVQLKFSRRPYEIPEKK